MTLSAPVSNNVSAKRSPRLRTFGFIALGFCALGYAGFVASFFAIKASYVSMAVGLTMAGVFGVVGEAGLWIGAACLGLSFYARRREKLARWFGRVKGNLARSS
ncbi:MULTISPECIES: hypothetical protein [unclassified Brevundimonas]|uniref:hypothetical protein n=1 Tax=unclassified Brevundimonas TaxID=2622653 RepID=UPI0025B8D40C|nr:MULTISPECIES: hypothetical protein [unclassified Brevundimonas]